MDDLVIKLDKKVVQKALSYLQGMPNEAPKAIARAMNRAISSAKTEAGRAIRQVYTVKTRDFTQTVKLVRAKPNSLEAQFSSRSFENSLSYAHFKYSPKSPTTGSNQKPVKAEIRKGSPFIVDKGFVYNDNVFRREGKSRLPIFVKTGPTVPQMLNTDNIVESVSNKAQDTFEKRISHEVNALLTGKVK